MKYDCLIVDDEALLGKSTEEYLNMFDIKTKWVSNIKDAKEFLKENSIIVMLLDINLENESGYDFCKEIRRDNDFPILFISARNTDNDKIIALSIGGDDYIEKPYSLMVLQAKLKAILKRFKDTTNIYENDYFKVDFISKKLYVSGVECKLTAMEYKLLSYFINNRKRAISKEELFNKVWNDSFTQDGTLNVHIRHLREYIEPDIKNPRFIITLYKEGYRFED